MGLLESVVGGLIGGGKASPLQGILMNMLGGTQNSGMEGGIGGLGGLVSAFEQAGLGDVVRSWIGDGANQPVSPDQLRGVFGEERARGMAGASGMTLDDFLSQLSRHLPNAVDGMTPQGRQPGEAPVPV